MSETTTEKKPPTKKWKRLPSRKEAILGIENTPTDTALVPVKKKKPKPVDMVYPPQFDGFNPPTTLWRSRTIGNQTVELPNGQKQTGVLHLEGCGSAPADIMFISPCVMNEELFAGRYGGRPRMMQGAPANLFLRNLARSGFKESDWFYTALTKYNVPRLKPNAADVRWGMPALEDEIRTVKPKIIVCLGKIPFDTLLGRKYDLRDVQGGFFYLEKYDCQLYVMDSLITTLMKPESLERAVTDLREIKRELDASRGIPRIKVPTNYRTVATGDALRQLVAEILALKPRYLSVDCEWHGQTPHAANALLRSLQVCWQAGHAAYIRFAGEQCSYEMDISYDEAAEILDPLLNNPEIMLVGHNFVADALWMNKFLRVNTYKRCAFDTMFAQQTINEYADLKLERLAVRYTDLGRYDLPLTIWKKDNKFDEEDNDGYGYIPDALIIPYGNRDVDATLRIFPILMQELIRQGLWSYYTRIALPFTTDGFFELSDTGLPISRPFLDEMRATFARNQRTLIDIFRRQVTTEASGYLFSFLLSQSKEKAMAVFGEMQRLLNLSKEAPAKEQNRLRAEAETWFKGLIPDAITLAKGYPIFEHWWESPDFNTNSTDFLKRWLFKVKGHEPLQTTKKDGIQMAWERVALLPPEKRAEYEPAADKKTIKLIADKDPLVMQLQELKAIGNVVKAFLKEPDPETGKENGLHKWIQTDERVHANFALTETGRPRAWKPNILNWPKAVSRPIEAAFARIQALDPLQKETPSSLRSVVQAPPGWAFVDMDLKTAEVVALAFLAGDDAMIKVLYDPDTQFAYKRVTKANGDISEKEVRIAFNEITKAPESARDPKLLTPDTDPDLVRMPDGKLKHPRRDLHWEMAEQVNLQIREKLDKEIDRGAGKIANFAVPYGASATLLDRQVEVATGKKPPEGNGQKLIDAYSTNYAIAARYLKSMEDLVTTPGYYRAISGRVRHFFFNNLIDVHGLSEWSAKGILSPLTRQARNFPMQNLVADSTARALLRFTEERRKRGMQTRVMMLLYDAVTAIAPMEELKEATSLLQSCLTDWTQWTVHGRTFNFDVDIGHSFRWGCKPSQDEKQILKKYL